MNHRPLVIVLVGGILAALAFAGGYLTARVGPIHVERVVGTTFLNGSTPMVDIDEAPSSVYSPQIVLDGAYGSECLVPYGHGQRVEVGVVPFAPESDMVGGDVAVWLKCLSGPTKIDRWRARAEFDPELFAEAYPELPDRGDRVRYTGSTYLGSRSEPLGVPDLANGMTGTVWGYSEGLVIVAWEGGPTLALPTGDVELING